MTVETTTSRQALTFDGVTVAFDFTFPYIEATDINVYVGSDLVAATDYTITANPTGVGGTVTFDTAPAAGTGMLVRNAPYTQEARIPNVDKMGQGLLENALDKVTILTQQLQDTTERSLTYPVYADTTGISSEIPVPEALGYLRGNAAGTAYETSLSVEAAFTVPGLTGEDGNFVRVNTGGTNFQYDTVAEVKTALGLAALAYLSTVGTAQIDANAVTPAKFEANKLVGSYCRFGIVKASGANGGTTTGGSVTTTLPIDTEIYDPDGLFVRSGSAFTLAPGDYYMEGWQRFYTSTTNSNNELELYDVTASAVVSTVYCMPSWGAGAANPETVVHLFGNFTCTEASPGVNRTYRLRYRVGNGVANTGLGVGTGSNTLVHGHFKLIKES